MKKRKSPNAGKILTTDALKSMDEVQRVKDVLRDDPRSYAMFVTAINVALRASDLLKLKRSDIQGNELFIREKKTKKLRRITLNQPTLDAINTYLLTRTDDMDLLFKGQRGRMYHGYFGWMIKQWFTKAGIPQGRWATHSLRKTFVRLNYERGVPLATLMTICNHGSERNTLTYCGITEEEIQRVYEHAL
jgi:integrase